MYKFICTIIFLTNYLLLIQCEKARFRVIREWKYVNFTWPDDETYTTSAENGHYVPDNNLISGIKYFEDHYYITLPRMKEGVPATLTRIPAGKVQDASPPLEPFPSWEMNKAGDCNALQNVQNIEIDTRGQVWIIDGGRINTLTSNPVVKCPPKLVIFDIKNNNTNLIYNFPETVAKKNGSFLYDLVVDNTDGGYAYITDNSGSDPGIIVYSIKLGKSWKIRHPKTMKADPTSTFFTVNGVSISSPINIAGIALGPKIHATGPNIVLNEDREVFYCPLSSLHLYAINSSVLQQEKSGEGEEYTGEIRDVGLKSSQTVGMIMDNKGVLYYSLIGSNTISKWDSHTPFLSGQIPIGRDDEYIQWPNSFTLDPLGNLSVISNKLQIFIFEKLDMSKNNFRIMSVHVGAKSYLYDEDFEYNEPTVRTSTMDHSGGSMHPEHDHSMHEHNNSMQDNNQEHGMMMHDHTMSHQQPQYDDHIVNVTMVSSSNKIFYNTLWCLIPALFFIKIVT